VANNTLRATARAYNKSMKPGDLLKSRSHGWLAIAVEVIDDYYVRLVWLADTPLDGIVAPGEIDHCVISRMEIISESR